ncbi:hypothetical protein D922_02721 [Enterococcus faecalis 06-MB-DW-09]|nr:hypothetical protein D922_02721 [Enterococcus faecalis 06-MB-DW-09]
MLVNEVPLLLLLEFSFDFFGRDHNAFSLTTESLEELRSID